ncbi:SRPBCC family protein [Lentzea sp. CA-135723]|uniref:SRPBCC family protein n=1 Tax=Lentzea sp. CA-135723 TaxID=3239950 RepID=UPI003D8AA39C
MPTITLTQQTTASPAQFVAALTDFGPGRADLFPNSADADLRVHDRGDTFADVTEGSGGIWERLRYDWSDPARIVLTTVDSNVWGGRSGHTYTFTKDDGTTVVHAQVVREGKNLKGKLLGFVLGLFGRKVLGGALEKTVRAVEARA